MYKIFTDHWEFWNNKPMMLRLLLSIFLLFFSIGITYFASSYTDTYTGHVVPDLLLDHIPVVNVGYVFFQGSLVVIAVLVGVLLLTPKFIPFVLESSSIFFLVRSFFMVMTHLSAPSVEYYSYIEREHHISQTLFTISSGNDLFFSGHAGYPILLMLIFWINHYLRYFFFACSIIGSVAVIIGHLHYSIDVFSAYFIAYGIFELSRRIFRSEYALTQAL
jgi:hypothetical protein